MSLRTSFCNKSIIKSDFKRLWWIPALHTLALFMFSVYPFIDFFFNRHQGLSYMPEVERFAQSSLYGYSSPFYFFALVVPVLLAVFLFSYLQSGRPSTFQHSVPVLRKTHFTSHFISGVIMFLIPIIVNSAILLLARFDSSFAESFKISHLFIILGITMVYSLLAFAGGIFVSMITANVVSSIIFTYVFAVLPIVCEAFITYFLSTQLYGYPENNIFLMNTLYFAPLDLLEPFNILLYIGIAVAFLVAGYFIYKARALENHSEVVAFPSLQPVFIYGAGIVCGAIGFSYFNALWSMNNALYLIPLGVLGIIIATMIVKKSFRVIRSILKPILIYSAAIVLVFVTLHFDLTGYETRIPKHEDIEGVTVELNFNHTETYYGSYGQRMYVGKPFKPYITDNAVIAHVEALHADLINDRYSTNVNGRRIELEYQLKNGRTLKRTYIADMHAQKELFEPICESDVIRSVFFPVLRENDRDYTRVQLLQSGIIGGLKEFEIVKEIHSELLPALKTDLKNAEFEEYGGRMSTVARLRLFYTEPLYYENGKAVPDDSLPEHSESYFIRPSYTNTIAVLEKYNINVVFPKADDIAKIGVDYYKARSTASADITVEKKAIGARNFDLVIEDRAQIEELLNYSDNLNWVDNYTLNLEFFLADGTGFSKEVDYDDPNLPTFLKDAFK